MFLCICNLVIRDATEILSIPLPRSSGHDCLVWRYTKNGYYYVKSEYAVDMSLEGSERQLNQFGDVVLNVSLLALDFNEEVYSFHVYVYFVKLILKTLGICSLPALMEEPTGDSLGY